MWVYDFEVFEHDWMVVFEELSSDKQVEFVNDVEGIREFYSKNSDRLHIGFNNKRYDDYIYKTILLGEDPKRTNDIIIEEGNILKLFKIMNMFKFPLFSFDISQDAVRGSLKEFEGYMGLDIEESTIPWDIDRPLTDEEIEDTLRYCRHDVTATKKLVFERFTNLKTKMQLVDTFGLTKEDLRRTNPQLTAMILGTTKAKVYDDEFDPYIPPKELDLNENANILKFYEKIDYDDELLVNLDGVEHTLRFGGLHGARPNFTYEGEMWLLDVSSYYPSMMIEYDYLSRSVPPLKRNLFKELYDTRFRLRDEGKHEEQEIYKLILNSTYGCLKDQYNGLYDPRQSNNVCITGQLLLVDLIEKILPHSKLVQSNTDGILIIPYNKGAIKKHVEEWQARTRLHMDIDKFSAIYQKDVNNYIVVEEDGSVYGIGGMVRQAKLIGGSGLRKSLAILDDCVVEYFVNGKTPEEIIYGETDITRFQLITKTGRTYDDTIWRNGESEISINKVNRVYASNNKKHGGVFKVKEEDTYHKLPNSPEQSIVDNRGEIKWSELDLNWYVNMAYRRIDQYKGE